MRADAIDAEIERRKALRDALNESDTLAVYNAYFDACERANKYPLTYDAWLARRFTLTSGE
jgi:hypothetical protein